MAPGVLPIEAAFNLYIFMTDRSWCRCTVDCHYVLSVPAPAVAECRSLRGGGPTSSRCPFVK